MFPLVIDNTGKKDAKSRCSRLRKAFEDPLMPIHLSFFSPAPNLFTTYHKFSQRPDPLSYKVYPVTEDFVRRLPTVTYQLSRFIPSIGSNKLLIICKYLPKILFFISKKIYFIGILVIFRQIIMGDNRDSYLANALLDNYEEPLDTSLISNNPSILSIGNNFNTPIIQNNEKQHPLPESTPNLPPNFKNKTPAKSKSIQELESFID